jgi:hypothetical protein
LTDSGTGRRTIKIDDKDNDIGHQFQRVMGRCISILSGLIEEKEQAVSTVQAYLL